MAKLDLASSEWCQLIFEGKNQAYGAYRMRANSPKRHTVAMLIVVAIAIVGFTIPTLLKLATPEQKEVMTEVTTLSKLAEPEIKQEEMKRVEPVAPPPPALKSSIKFTAPVIKKDEEVSEDDEIKSQEELTSTKVAISIADVKGNDEIDGQDIADFKDLNQLTHLDVSLSDEKQVSMVTNFIEEASQNKWLDDETIKDFIYNYYSEIDLQTVDQEDYQRISSLCQNYDIDINLLTKGH